jgi:tRNA threonylcarbamoyladenosine biosynthesis protein TsaE
MPPAGQISIESLQQLADWTKGLSEKLPGRLVVLLRGEPGAGKTELVKAFVRGLLAKVSQLENRQDSQASEVSSPTFALHHSYEVGQRIVDHWDLYRLEGEDDLESSGFWDQFSAEEFLIFVEWPDRLQVKWIPQNLELWQIEIKRVIGENSESKRSITVEVLQKAL